MWAEACSTKREENWRSRILTASDVPNGLSGSMTRLMKTLMTLSLLSWSGAGTPPISLSPSPFSKEFAKLGMRICWRGDCLPVSWLFTCKLIANYYWSSARMYECMRACMLQKPFRKILCFQVTTFQMFMCNSRKNFMHLVSESLLILFWFLLVLLCSQHFSCGVIVQLHKAFINHLM